MMSLHIRRRLAVLMSRTAWAHIAVIVALLVSGHAIADPLPLPTKLWPESGDHGGVVLHKATGPWTVANGSVLGDGAGGAWAVWAYQYLGSGPYSSMVFAARLDEMGAVVASASPISPHALASPLGMVRDDGAGVVVVWKHAGLHYAQRLDGVGTPQWAPKNGVLIDLCPCAPGPVHVVADGLGGAYLSVGNRLARVTAFGKVELGPSTGGLEMTPKGEAVDLLHAAAPTVVIAPEPASSTAPPTSPPKPAIIDPALLDRLSGPFVSYFPPGAKLAAVPGGIMAAWHEELATKQIIRVHLQQIAGGLFGGPGTDEFPFADAVGSKIFAPDGSGGLFVVWLEKPASFSATGQPRRIKVGRINSDGKAAWSAPVALFDATALPKDWTNMGIAASYIGGGRLVVAWTDHRFEETPAEAKTKGIPWKANPDIRARGIDNDGVPFWASDGVLIPREYNAQTPEADGSQGIPDIVGDGTDGALFAYVDYANYGPDIGYTHLSAAGSQMVAGLVVQNTEATQGIIQNAPKIDFDGAGAKPGAVMVWIESDGSHHRLVAQKVGLK